MGGGSGRGFVVTNWEEGTEEEKGNEEWNEEGKEKNGAVKEEKEEEGG